jgi:hypothetical protein
MPQNRLIQVSPGVQFSMTWVEDKKYDDISHLGFWKTLKRGSLAIYGDKVYYIDRKERTLYDPKHNIVRENLEGVGDRSVEEFPYFFCGPNHLPQTEHTWAHMKEDTLSELVAKYGSTENALIEYTLDDWRRAEEFGFSWNYIGYVAKLTIDDVEVGSDDLWGIESDVDNDTVEQYEEDALWSCLSQAVHEVGSASFGPTQLNKLRRIIGNDLFTYVAQTTLNYGEELYVE